MSDTPWRTDTFAEAAPDFFSDDRVYRDSVCMVHPPLITSGQPPFTWYVHVSLVGWPVLVGQHERCWDRFAARHLCEAWVDYLYTLGAEGDPYGRPDGPPPTHEYVGRVNWPPVETDSMGGAHTHAVLGEVGVAMSVDRSDSTWPGDEGWRFTARGRIHRVGISAHGSHLGTAQEAMDAVESAALRLAALGVRDPGCGRGDFWDRPSPSRHRCDLPAHHAGERHVQLSADGSPEFEWAA